MRQSSLLLLLLLLASTLVQAQEKDSYTARYDNGKKLIEQKEYELAYQELKPLLGNQYDKRGHAPYVHYFYALAASQSGNENEAMSALRSLKSKYPDWKSPEVDYLLADVYFRTNKVREAIEVTQELRKEDIKRDARQMKLSYLAMEDLTQLQLLHERFPDDKEVALIYAKKLVTNPTKENIKKAESLSEKFDFKDKSIATVDIKESEKKSSYNVVVIFPFMYAQRQEDKNYRNNQFALDMYEGVKLAVEKLREDGKHIRLKVFDSEQDSVKVQKILAGLNPDSVDLILGPIYPGGSMLAATYAKVNQVMMVNPLTDNGQITKNNPFAFSLTPCVETRASVLINYVKAQKSAQPAVILYTDLPREKKDANTYKAVAKKSGIETVGMLDLRKENLHNLTQRLQKFDFDKLSHLYVKSDKSYVGAAVVNSLTVLGTNVPVFVDEEWLKFSSLTFEQMERLNFHFISTDVIAYTDLDVQDFQKKYIVRSNLFPSIFAFKGYDMMMLFGDYMHRYGNRCMKKLHEPEYIPGHLTPGFKFSSGNDNSLVRIYKFEEGLYTLQNPVNQEDNEQAEAIKSEGVTK